MSLFNELKRRNVIRVAAAYLIIGWLLAQVSTTLEAALNLPPWFDTIIVTVMLIGFPIALIIAWVYELTPEGIRKEKDIESDDSISKQTGKKLNYITIVAALAVAGMFAWQQMNDKDIGDTSSRKNDLVEVENNKAVIKNAVSPEQLGTQKEDNNQKPKIGIAVLPFENLSEDKNNAFFAGGVYEDVLTYLSRIVQWRVISRTSMEKIAEKGMEIKEIGTHLNVSHVLEGSVRRAANRVRVTVQLIDARNDAHIWAENYDRKLEDIFAIQTEIAEKIAQQLKVELTPKQHQLIASQPTENIAAYDLFIKARETTRVWRESKGFAEQIPLLEKALTLDPKFVEAQILLVSSYGRMFWTGADTEGVYRLKSEALKNQILAEHPHGFYAYAAQGIYLYTIKRDYQAALEQLQKALLERPDDITIISYIASSYKRLGLFEKSITVNNKLLSLDPESESTSNEILQNLIYLNKIDEVFVLNKSIIKKYPNNIQSQGLLANIYFNYFGDVTKFMEIYKNLFKKSNDSNDLYFRLLAHNKDTDEVISTLENLQDGEEPLDDAFFINLQISELYNLNGQEKKSQEYAKKAFLYLKEFALNINDVDNYPYAKGVYASFIYLSCLANDQSSFKQWEATFNHTKNPEPIYNKFRYETQYSIALAECGNIDKAWEMMKNISGKPTSYITNWTLALDPLYQHYFSEIPEYKTMVKRLKEEKAKKEMQE